MYNLALFLISFDIFMPFFIAVFNLPSEMRWISHALNFVLLFLTIVLKIKFLRFNLFEISAIFVVILGLVTAQLNKQSFLTTIWGLWVFLRYVMIGILFSHLPFTKRYYRILQVFIFTTLSIELCVQVGQYVTGVPVGDNLSGTFGVHGTARLLFFILVAVVLSFGEWISQKKISKLLVVIFMGIFSSALGEMKMYFLAIILLGAVSLVLYFQRHKIEKRLIFGIIGLMVAIFYTPRIMDKITYKDENLSFIQRIIDTSYVEHYLTFITIDQNGNYDIGRYFYLQYVWNYLNSEPIRLLVGDGIGSRGESQSLQTVGVQLLENEFGLKTGTSLVIFLGEMGIIGMVFLLLFIIFTATRCYFLIHSGASSYIISLSCAVLIFTIFWPLWLWYTTAWTLPGSMPLYWLLWGATMNFYSQIKRGRKAYA